MLETTKRCKYCDEEIKANAIKCKHCGSMLTDSGVPTGDVTPESQLKIVLSEKYNIIDEIDTWYEWNITDLVKQKIGSELTLAIVQDDKILNFENMVAFRSTEALENFPQLVVLGNEKQTLANTFTSYNNNIGIVIVELMIVMFGIVVLIGLSIRKKHSRIE